jgi:hypothetical protein
MPLGPLVMPLGPLVMLLVLLESSWYYWKALGTIEKPMMSKACTELVS